MDERERLVRVIFPDMETDQIHYTMRHLTVSWCEMVEANVYPEKASAARELRRLLLG